MKIEELKQGDEIIDVAFPHIRIYKYCCPHPLNPKYQILLDENKDPFKIFNQKLQIILDKELTHSSAKSLLIEAHKQAIRDINEFL